jgi:hypothetical protein
MAFLNHIRSQTALHLRLKRTMFFLKFEYFVTSADQLTGIYHREKVVDRLNP